MVRGLILCGLAWSVSCAPAASGPSVGQSPTQTNRGRLGQRDVTVELAAGDLQIQVTPLEDWVLNATASDTRARLENLVSLYAEPLKAESGDADPLLLLVSFFTEESTQSFEPEFLNIIAQGVRARPLAIQALTPNWRSHRLPQRSTETAVYAFEGTLDIRREMTVEYDGISSDEWRLIVTRIEAELR